VGVFDLPHEGRLRPHPLEIVDDSEAHITAFIDPARMDEQSVGKEDVTDAT
jgi:hypothetical protein